MKIIIFYLKGSVDLIEMSILDLKDSNTLLSKYISEGKPFNALRFGLGNETYIAVKLHLHRQFDQQLWKSDYPHIHGIYSKNNDINDIIKFSLLYISCFMSNDLLSSFTGRHRQIRDIQNHYSNLAKNTQIHSRVLEPFYVIKDLPDEKPWSHVLIDKKVLIIHPFVDSFQKQISNNFVIDKNKPIFLPGQKFEFYKAYQTSTGNYLHSNSFETLELMKKDISSIDFDIALLSCGSYGAPLCHFIKNELNKSAIYLGGGLQLLFGVKGKRWETHDIISKIIENSDVPFINPSDDEQIPNYKIVENGCYW